VPGGDQAGAAGARLAGGDQAEAGDRMGHQGRPWLAYGRAASAKDRAHQQREVPGMIAASSASPCSSTSTRRGTRPLRRRQRARRARAALADRGVRSSKVNGPRHRGLSPAKINRATSDLTTIRWWPKMIAPTDRARSAGADFNGRRRRAPLTSPPHITSQALPWAA
jgi:hypothetical protein